MIKISKRKLIIMVGLFLSLIAGILVLIYGIRGYIYDPLYQFYYNIALALSILTIIGVIVGFFKSNVGIAITSIIGIIGFVLIVLMQLGGWDLWLVLSVILILIGSIIGIIGYYLLKRKERSKVSRIVAEQMKRVFNLSIVLLVCGWSVFLIIGSLFIWGFLIYVYMFINIFIMPIGLIGIIGLLIGFIGLYGIIVYRTKPEKLRNYLLKRQKSREEHKVQA